MLLLLACLSIELAAGELCELNDAANAVCLPDVPEGPVEGEPSAPAVLPGAAPPPDLPAGPVVEILTHAGMSLNRPRSLHEGQLLVAELRPAPGCGSEVMVYWQKEFFRAHAVRDGWYHALVPVSVSSKPGMHNLSVFCGTQAASFDLELTAGTFPESKLRVDPKFSAPPPPRVAEERQAIAAAFAQSAAQRLWTASFVKPCAGVETSPFGVRRTYNGRLKGRHMGQDFDGKMGEALWAANDGVVVLAAQDFFFVGNAVFIDHGERTYTMYFHMSQLHVKTGDKVVRGQLLGNIGDTGRVTGPHVHFAVKLAGTYINPADLLAYDPTLLHDAPGPAISQEP